MRKRIMPTVIALIICFFLFVYVNLNEVAEIPTPGTDLPVDLAEIPLKEVKAVNWEIPQHPNAAAGVPAPAEGEWDKEIQVEVKTENNSTLYEIQKPRKLRGETSEFEGLLRNFEMFQSERVISKTATDTAPFGIGTGSPQLTIKTASQTVAFKLGSPSPVGGSVYLQKVGDPALYLVSAQVSAAFSKTVKDLRSKNIFFEDFSSIGSMTIQNPSGTFRLEQSKNVTWEIVEPKPFAADGGEVTGMIFGLRDMRVQSFVNDDPTGKESYGFEKPLYKATLVDSKTGKTYEFLVGKEENGKVYVKRSDAPAVYSVARTQLAILDKDFNRLRTKELPKMTRGEVKKLSLKTASDSFILEFASDTWKVDGKNIAAEKVNDLIDAYNSDRINAFIPWSDRGKEDLEKTAGCSQFILESAGSAQTIFFGKGDGNNISLVLEGNEEVVKVPMHLFDKFRALLETCKQALTAQQAPPPAASGVATVSPASGTPGPAVVNPNQPVVAPLPLTASSPTGGS